MMIIEKDMVVKGLQCCTKQIMECNECPYQPLGIGCIETLKRDALALMSAKRTAEPVLNGRMWVCPICGHPLGIYRDDVRCNYCPECGREMKWDA